MNIARHELRAYDDAHMVAEKLVGVALKRSAGNDVTAIVVRLFPAQGSSREEPESVPVKCGFVRVPTSPNFVRVVGGFGAASGCGAPDHAKMTRSGQRRSFPTSFNVW